MGKIGGESVTRVSGLEGAVLVKLGWWFQGSVEQTNGLNEPCFINTHIWTVYAGCDSAARFKHDPYKHKTHQNHHVYTFHFAPFPLKGA